MDRYEIVAAITAERDHQDEKWGTEFDDKNTPNDWIAYLTMYVGRAVTMPWNRMQFRIAVLKVAAICFAILEREDYAPRHYDVQALMSHDTKSSHEEHGNPVG